MQQVRIPRTERGWGGTVHPKEADQLDRVGRRRLTAGRFPFDRIQIRRDERGLSRRDHIEKGRPRQQRRIQPQRMIRNQVIDARCAEVIATHGAASDATRGEHGVPHRVGPI